MFSEQWVSEEKVGVHENLGLCPGCDANQLRGVILGTSLYLLECSFFFCEFWVMVLVISPSFVKLELDNVYHVAFLKSK